MTLKDLKEAIKIWKIAYDVNQENKIKALYKEKILQATAIYDKEILRLMKEQYPEEFV